MLRYILLLPLLLILAAMSGVLPTGHTPEFLQDLGPFAAQSRPDPAPELLARAERAQRNGDFEAALAVYRELARHPDPDLVADVAVRQAETLLAAGRTAEVDEVLQPLLDASAPQLARQRATFLLAEAARAQKDCGRAEPLYRAYLDSGTITASYARLALAECAEQRNDADAMTEQAQAVRDASGPRRLTLEATEKLALAELKRGHPRQFVQLYDELFNLGATRSYKGDVLFTAAEVSKNIGDRQPTIDRLARLIRELPEHRRAAEALDMLNSMQGAGAVTWTQASLVRLNARQYQSALDGFNTALAEAPDGPEAAAARYHRSVAILQLGNESQAARDMRAMAERHPASTLAPQALLRAGRIFESHGSFGEAQATYTQLANGYAATTNGRSGRFRLGFIHYQRGDLTGAIATWESLANDPAERAPASLALLWQGKAHERLGNTGEAVARWQRAGQVGPDVFGGLRAQALLLGDSLAGHVVQPSSNAALSPGEFELAELEDWLIAQGTTGQALGEARETDPFYLRAQELIRLGLRDQATWELEAVQTRAAQSPHSAAELYQLAAIQAELGYPSRALATADALARQIGGPRTTLPLAVQKLLYPLAYDDLILPHSANQGVDPLLFAALVRQESHFDARARSSANAIGLSQVIPPTGREIANALGRTGFTADDLLRPVVNVEFGTWYLARQLERYGGAIYPSLAAYNAGAGAVDRWLGELGRGDMDFFAERIPYAETNHYCQIVYENYGMYRAIYGR